MVAAVEQEVGSPPQVFAFIASEASNFTVQHALEEAWAKVGNGSRIVFNFAEVGFGRGPAADLKEHGLQRASFRAEYGRRENPTALTIGVVQVVERYGLGGLSMFSYAVAAKQAGRGGLCGSLSIVLPRSFDISRVYVEEIPFDQALGEFLGQDTRKLRLLKQVGPVSALTGGAMSDEDIIRDTLVVALAELKIS